MFTSPQSNKALPPASPANVAGARTYRVGTLVYTRRTLLQVMFWMLWGDFFFTLREALNPSLIPLQLRWAGAGDTLIGILGTSLPSAVAFFWFPVAGTQSDRHRGRLGRRRPFLLWCTPPVVLSLILLGAAKPSGAWVHKMLGVVGWAGSTAAGCTIAWIGVCVLVFLVFNAYILQEYACLFVDVIPQEVMGRFLGLYRAIGALGSLVFNRWMLGWAEGYTFHIYCLIGLLYAAAFLLIVWRVKEGDYPPPSPKPAGGPVGAIKGFLRESFTHRFYLNFYLVTFFSWASFVPLSFVIFFGTRAGRPDYAATLGLTLQEFGQVKGWTFLIQVPVFFIAGYFVDRFHPLRVAMLGMLLTSLSYFCCFWFIHSSSTLLLWWGLTQAAFAIFMGASATLAPKLFPRDKYGQFVSANAIFGIISLVVAPPIVGLLMESIRDYRYVFIFCGICTTITFVACIALFLQWRKLGGDLHYTPPNTDRGDPKPDFTGNPELS